MLIAPETAATFFGVSILLAASPGPDNMFVLLQSAMHGPWSGIKVVLGLCSGLVVHTTAVAVGISALIVANPVGMAALKLTGAVYLVWIAWQTLRAPVGEFASAESPVETENGLRLYLRGILMNVMNPKVSIFFLAFLPQFVSQETGPVWRQIVVLGGLFAIATLLVFGTIAAFAGEFGKLFRRSSRLHRTLNWLSAAVFFGLAIRLLA